VKSCQNGASSPPCSPHDARTLCSRSQGWRPSRCDGSSEVATLDSCTHDVSAERLRGVSTLPLREMGDADGVGGGVGCGVWGGEGLRVGLMRFTKKVSKTTPRQRDGTVHLKPDAWVGMDRAPQTDTLPPTGVYKSHVWPYRLSRPQAAKSRSTQPKHPSSLVAGKRARVLHANVVSQDLIRHSVHAS
jgi:hypothetical protein